MRREWPTARHRGAGLRAVAGNLHAGRLRSWPGNPTRALPRRAVCAAVVAGFWMLEGWWCICIFDADFPTSRMFDHAPVVLFVCFVQSHKSRSGPQHVARAVSIFSGFCEQRIAMKA